MGSTSNPVLAMADSNWSSLLPGRNPTGSTGAGTSSVPSTGTSSGQNPVLPPTNLPPGAPASNPYAPGSAVPTFGANSGGGYSPTNLVGGGGTPGSGSGSSPLGGISNLSPADAKRLHDELGATYGNGVAAAIMSFLQGGAGFNQAAINNLFAALQPGIERGTESLMQQFSTSGNRFGSGAQIGLADYLSQVQLNEGQIEAQLYETSVSDYINTLMGITGGTKEHLANSPSLFEQITSPLADLTGSHTLPGFGGGSSSGGGGGGGIGQQLMQLLSTAALA
jgi:hypothetical protein